MSLLNKRPPAMLRAVEIVLLLLALMVATACPSCAFDFRGTGVVFLHGKGVFVGAFDGGIPAALEARGALVASPEMPWSFGRLYGATFEAAMLEIDAAVAELKGKGAIEIVVIGHSLGANAAIAYAARRSGVAAVVALAPGHLPESSPLRALSADALIDARQLIAAGNTARRIWPDMILGVPTIASATPAVYVSMFDPNGPAVIPKNVAAMRSIPLLWVVGLLDPIFFRGRDYAFSVAQSPKSRYVQVLADHLSTPMIAKSTVMEWLKSL